jgi:hypothetical protein
VTRLVDGFAGGIGSLAQSVEQLMTEPYPAIIDGGV